MQKILFALFIFTFTVCLGQIEITQTTHITPVDGKNLRYYISSQKNSSIEEIQARLAEFKPIESDMVNLGFEKRDVWFYFETKNNSKHRLNRLLKIDNPIIDEIDVYKKIGVHSFKHIGKSGDQLPYSYRYNGNRELVFPLFLEPQQTNGFLFKVNNGGEQFYFQASIMHEKTFDEENNSSLVFYGLLFGIMFFIILLNLFVGIIFKQKTAFLYTAYSLTFTLLQLSLLGFGTTLLWKDHFYLSNSANPLLATLSVYFFLRFTYLFLELKTVIPKIRPIVRFFELALFSNFILSFLPTFDYYNPAIVVNALTLLLNLFIIYPLIYALKTGSQAAKSYLIAFSVLQFSVFAFVLRNFGVIPNSFLAENGLQIGAAVEMIILTFAILQRFKAINDEAIFTLAETNKLKDNINQQLEKEVALRTQEIQLQRNELEVKNEEITSSIEYAKRIQFNLLPSNESIQKSLPNCAVFYLPKDIVAGDFYWFKTHVFNGEEWSFFAVADCTGHGVPGAMMSVLCMNALNESMAQLTDMNPANLLELVNEYLQRYLSSDKAHLADGMDIALVCINHKQKIVRFSGANNPLWILQNGELNVIHGTKRPIGKSESNTPFSIHEVKYEQPIRLFMFSDGCIDQFGAKSGKKLKTTGLKQFVFESRNLEATNQVKFIQESILEWKGDEEQLDDICFMLCELD